MKRIIITGPESTGKTNLAKQLASHYNTVFLPEYARTYIGNLNRPYRYEDVVLIAKMQIENEKKTFKKANNFLFIDTGLIITKVWFQEVYNKYPNWLDVAIRNSLPELYLVCDYDLAWVKDSVRENGSIEKRAYLMGRYIKEIENFGVKYHIISGRGLIRLQKAVSCVDKLKAISNN